MGCCHPVRAFKTGNKTDTGKDELIRCPGATTDLLSLDSATKRGFRVRLLDAPHVFVNGVPFLSSPVLQPCGKCVGCRMADAKQWKIRNCLEVAYHRNSYFLTATFDNAHLLPLRKECYVDYYQRFLKRLRFALKNDKLSYFGCFEFGEHTRRPHFHFILYTDLSDLKLIGINKFSSKVVSDAWLAGNCLIEPVEPGSIAYVCGYVQKKQEDAASDWKPPFKPFRVMSKNPAIGFRYLEENRSRFKDDYLVYGDFDGRQKGKHSSIMPQAFKRKLEKEPFYEEMHRLAVLAGENGDDVSKVVYRIADEFHLEDVKEYALHALVMSKRKETL